VYSQLMYKPHRASPVYRHFLFIQPNSLLQLLLVVTGQLADMPTCGCQLADESTCGLVNLQMKINERFMVTGHFGPKTLQHQNTSALVWMRGIPVSEKHCGIKSDGICAVGLLNTMVYRLAVLIFNRLSSSHNLFHFRKSYFQ